MNDDSQSQHILMHFKQRHSGFYSKSKDMIVGLKFPEEQVINKESKERIGLNWYSTSLIFCVKILTKV